MTINYSNINKDKRLATQYHKLNASKYQDVWDFQGLLHDSIKICKSQSSQLSGQENQQPLNHLVFCEHKPVFTLGKSAKAANLLDTTENLHREGFEVFDINRGGDITYHGPGQLTGYLILDLELLYRDVHKYVRNIEEAIIILLDYYKLKGLRIEDFTGVWVHQNDLYYKVCAIGVHLSRWVSMHGFALNVNTDLSHFNRIMPCGIKDSDKTVSSLSALLGKEVDLVEVEEKLLSILSDVFDLDIVSLS